PQSTSNAQRVAANQAVISRAGLDAWLPRYEETSGGATSIGHIACSAVSRPATYSGANLLTVLTFDLASDALGSGDGVSIVADGPPAGAQASSSAVYVLSTRGPVMRLAGHVTGLGRAERIYSVRFMGPAGYVVTFRQTDPLYTVDMSDPAQPRVRGSVALTGYSAYLHPASDRRLIGIGRQADARGHAGGTQVSLF